MIVFAFFEKANFSTVESCIRSLAAEGRTVLFVKPFDYKEHARTISPFVIPADIPHVDICELAAEEDIPTGYRGRHESHFLLDALYRRDYIPFVEEMFARVSLATERLFRESRPEVVVLPEDTDYMKGRLGASLCRKLGIRTIAVLPVYYNIQLRYPMLGERLVSEYLVMNERARDRLIAAGAPHTGVHTIGHRSFDELPREGVAHGDRPFLYLLQDLPWEREIVSDLLAIFRSMPHLGLVIRPHPERPALSLADLPPNVSVGTGVGVDRASCVISQTSQGLYSALHCGVPIIAVNYGPFPLEIDLPSSTAVARDPADLEQWVRRAAVGSLPELSSLGGFLSPPGAAKRLFEIVRAA